MARTHKQERARGAAATKVPKTKRAVSPKASASTIQSAELTGERTPGNVTDDPVGRLYRQAYENNATPCMRCVALAWAGELRTEPVMPLFPQGLAPEAVDGSGPCCMDCAAADTVVKMLNRNRDVRERHMARWRTHPKLRIELAPRIRNIEASTGIDFGMARIAVANDRQESFRLPGVKMGLCYEGWVRASQPGEWQLHLAWMERVGLRSKEQEDFDDE